MVHYCLLLYGRRSRRGRWCRTEIIKASRRRICGRQPTPQWATISVSIASHKQISPDQASHCDWLTIKASLRCARELLLLQLLGQEESHNEEEEIYSPLQLTNGIFLYHLHAFAMKWLCNIPRVSALLIINSLDSRNLQLHSLKLPRKIDRWLPSDKQQNLVQHVWKEAVDPSLQITNAVITQSTGNKCVTRQSHGGKKLLEISIFWSISMMMAMSPLQEPSIFPAMETMDWMEHFKIFPSNRVYFI